MESGLYAGIDNGLKGGIVFIDSRGAVKERHIMPVITSEKGKTEYDVFLMVEAFKNKNIELVALEKAQAYPGQGVTAMFSVGKGFGLWQGILTALGIPFVIVPPQTWQGHVLAGMDRRDTKQASALFAQRMSPETNWRGTDRSKIIHDGLTDAFCLAHYILQRYGNKTNFNGSA